jgi:SAM-dependent methyltransferase
MLALHYAVRGWGIDLSAEMLAVARAHQIPAGVQVQVAAAEDLPFPEGSFERAVTTTAAHLFDRSRAFPEIWRVLEPGGRLTIMTPDPAAFTGMWMAWLFPSSVEIEQRRFPTAEALEHDLHRAGFARCTWARRTLFCSFSKGVALQKLRERHVSTFVLLDDAEYRADVEQAERDLPDPVEYTQQTLFVSAERG